MPVLTRVEGVLLQLIEIPGLIPGAGEGRGGGRALPGVLRGSDGIVLCHDTTAPLEGLDAVRRELVAAGIDPPAILAATKADEAGPEALERLALAVPDLEVLPVSVLDDESLDAFRGAVWRLTGLIRIFLRHGGEPDADPIAVRPSTTVADVAGQIHHELGRQCRGARVWGPSARFPGQRVGRAHRVADGDVVEIV